MKSLQWHEPASYRREVARRWGRENPWESTKFAALAFATILTLRFLSQFGKANPNLLDWPKVVALAALFAVFVAYIFPWLILWLPHSIVILSPKGVNNNIVGKVARITFWPWSEIAYFSSAFETVGGRAVPTLSLHDGDGRVLATFGLSPKVSLDAVERCLQQYGKPLRREPIRTG